MGEIPKIPNSVPELLAAIDAPTEVKRRQKTRAETGLQIARIANKLIDRAHRLGPNLHKGYGDQASRLALAKRITLKGHDAGYSLTLAPDSSTRRSGPIQVSNRTSDSPYLADVRWSLIAGSVYSINGRGLTVTNHRQGLLRRKAVEMESDEYPDGSGDYQRRFRRSENRDITHAAAGLAEVRGALAEQELIAQRYDFSSTLTHIQNLPETPEPS